MSTTAQISVDVRFPTRALIDGQLVGAADQATFDSIDPATGRVLAAVTACGPEDVDRAVAVARRAFESGVWSQATPAERKDIMLRFVALLRDNAEELATLESLDAGKPISDTRTLDIPDAISTIQWYAEAIDKLYGRTSPTYGTSLGLITREPIGVVAAVVPWNFPLATLSWKLGPALAAGNSVIVKPAELTSFSTLRVGEIAMEAGIPAGVLQVLPGLGHEAGRALGLHPDVDMVAFTGSTEVGRMFLRYSADSNLKRVVLECGGKSPQIVLGDCADRLPAIAEELAGAAFWNMGENCTCGSRILVHRSLHDAFVEHFVAATASWKVGPPQDPETKIGPMVERAHLDKVVGYIEAGRNAGATVATGGRVVFEETGGWFVEPTVFTGVTPDMSIAREEIFGPVVSVLSFDTEDEAVAIANDSEYGLAASVFTNDINAAHRVSRAVKAGTVAVNCYSEGDISTPFAGMKTSGFGGYEKGLEAFDQYTDLKTTWIALG